MTREDMLAKTKALREEMLKDKTWMDMGWTRWDEYPHPCVSDLHLRLNDLTEAAWHVHCRREDF